VDLNASKLVLMQSETRLIDVVRRCDHVSADGQSVVWAARLLGRPVPERVPGIDLMKALLAMAAEKRYAVFFLGSTDAILNSMAARLLGDHPALRIAGMHHGYFTKEDSPEVAARIRESRADMLFVGMPSPRKEYWIDENIRATGVRFAMGVGGSFDVIAGRLRRAPSWMRGAGLEWSYRLAQEPGRLWKRYLFGNARFLVLVAREYVRLARRTPG
jgi:N-acetylglucosaminyldiphosphoundecaprenol N-acetyl-beta-D-mannosaminyltransferase